MLEKGERLASSWWGSFQVDEGSFKGWWGSFQVGEGRFKL